jgi:CheY-like chemotaxis protein
LEHLTLIGYSILLVEPSAHLASDLASALDGAGAEILIASTSVEALPLAESAKLSGAILDYTQSITDGHRVARRLTVLGIPFLFCRDIGRNEAWPHAPVLNRPINGADLIVSLRHLLDPETAANTEHSAYAFKPPVRAEQRPVPPVT